MKDERAFTVKAMEAVRQRLRGAVVIKHADKATAGIPDFSASWHGQTYWAEMKLLRPGKRLRHIVEVAQLVLCNQLSVATNGRCWFFVLAPGETQVWTPARLFAYLNPKMVGSPWMDGAEPTRLPADADIEEVVMALRAKGAAAVEGTHPGLPARVMEAWR